MNHIVSCDKARKWQTLQFVKAAPSKAGALALCVTMLASTPLLAPSAAQSSDEGKGAAKFPLPKEVDEIVACQSIGNDDERLKCYDRSVTQFSDATRRGNVIVAEKKVVEQARKEIFGLSLSDNPIFGDKNDAGVKSIDTVITSAAQSRTGKWVFVVEGGASWRQTGTRTLRRRLEKDQKVTISRGLLGSFIAKFEGQKRTIKVVRVR